jgi:hypothetical protein
MFDNSRHPNGAQAVTTSDTAEVNYCGFYVGGTGDVKIDDAAGNTVTFKACPVGLLVHVGVTRIYATGTTATNIVGLVR